MICTSTADNLDQRTSLKKKLRLQRSIICHTFLFGSWYLVGTLLYQRSQCLQCFEFTGSWTGFGGQTEDYLKIKSYGFIKGVQANSIRGWACGTCLTTPRLRPFPTSIQDLPSAKAPEYQYIWSHLSHLYSNSLCAPTFGWSFRGYS